MVESIRQDIVYGLRQLKGSPGFTVVAVLSLALGIGANTAIFQLVDTIRFRMLPVSNPHELASIDFQSGAMLAGWTSTRNARLTSAQWEQIRSQQQGFSGVFAWSATRFNLAKGGESRPAEGLYVSGDFFRVLGVTSIMGRTITAQDDTAACSNLGAVISHSFWQSEFGGDSAVLNRTVSLDGNPVPVIGVTPVSFFGVEVGQQFDVAVPLCADAIFAENHKGRAPVRHAFWLSMMGRLKDGWTVDRAKAQLEAVSPGIMRETMPEIYRPEMAKKYLLNKLGATDGGTGISGLRRRYERPLWVLMATTGLVLLIACANLANLLLARASVREREFAVRLAIGASRGRLVRQLLVESLMLAGAGAVLGVGLARLLSQGLVSFITTKSNRLFVEMPLDWRILGFTLALSVVTCLLFGLLPAIRATYLVPASVIRAGGRGMTAGKERFSLRRTLVATQVALSLVLLAGSLMFVRSLRNLLTADTGFKAEGIVTVNIDFSKAGYAAERRIPMQRELNEKIAGVQGVLSAALVNFTPVSGSGWNNDIGVDTAPASNSGKLAWFNRTGPGYFNTMGTRLIAGRDFDDRDTKSSPKVAIVNETFARKYFGKPEIVGRTFRQEAPAGKPEPLYQIVGVVKDTKYGDLREEFRPIGFFPNAQNDDPGPNATLVVRMAGSPTEMMNAVKAAIAQISPSMGVQFQSFSAQLQESLLRERLMAVLSGGFAMLALLLATMGLYGVIAYMVARRRNEIGIRVALGADRGRVIRLVLNETLLLVGAGLIVGLLISFWSGKAASGLLYGLKEFDVASVLGACGFLALAGFIAAYAPARRAAALEPMKALRDE